jgi:acylaminoacyl-peptidase
MRPVRIDVCLLGLLALTSAGAAPPRKIVATDVYNITIPSDPQISPDGKRIVYVRQFADIMTDKRYSNLWIVNADGTDQRPLTSGNRSDTEPRWSPDGTRLAYTSDQDGRGDIYVRWLDSGQTARLTNAVEAPSGLSWSPDGKSLAFSARVASKGPHVGDLPMPPSGAKWADPPVVYDQLVYRFNAAGYLKPGRRQLFVVSAEGGAPRALTSDDFPNGGDELVANRAVWSPDGAGLIVSINRHPAADLEFFDSDVYEVRVSDGELHALTSRKGPDGSPVVSPSGKLIAYTGFDDRQQGHQTTGLYVMSRDGKGSKTLCESLDRDIQGPVWSPDGTGVYFQYDDEGETKIGFCSLEGKFRKVAGKVAAGMGASSSGSFSVSRTGTLAFTMGDWANPGDVALLALGQTRTLTALNHDFLAETSLGRVEEIWYPSQKDQRKVQGWIVYPPDFDKAKHYPLILEIHGGPFADYGNRFDYEKQAWAAMGYVVFYSNPRGSTSYGEAFANLIHHAYPGDDLFDLESGVDATIAKGSIDPNNLFVTGGSGGGVLTCWVIEHTKRYRAAAPTNPVINWYSFALTSDIPFITKYWFPGNPWDNTEEYMRRSLTNLVGHVTTPTLLMTGEADYRTPISETEQFYEALKLQNVEAVLVRVPEEPHGLRRRPSHGIARLVYIASWFDQHKAKS